jgi:hypothetical protein
MVTISCLSILGYWFPQVVGPIVSTAGGDGQMGVKKNGLSKGSFLNFGLKILNGGWGSSDLIDNGPLQFGAFFTTGVGFLLNPQFFHQII